MIGDRDFSWKDCECHRTSSTFDVFLPHISVTAGCKAAVVFMFFCSERNSGSISMRNLCINRFWLRAMRFPDSTSYTGTTPGCHPATSDMPFSLTSRDVPSDVSLETLFYLSLGFASEILLVCSCLPEQASLFFHSRVVACLPRLMKKPAVPATPPRPTGSQN